jgi:lipoprotein NlpI
VILPSQQIGIISGVRKIPLLVAMTLLLTAASADAASHPAVHAAARAGAFEDAKTGWEAFQRGDDGTALRLLTQAINANELAAKDQAVVYSYRGVVYNFQGKPDPAIADFDAAVGLEPTFTSAYANRATSYRMKSQYERALADYNIAIRINAKYAAAYRGRGAVNFFLGHYDRAAEDFQKTLELQPTNVYAALSLHRVRFKTGKPDEKEFAANIASVNRDAWPGPLVALFTGQMTPEQVQTAAGQGTVLQQRQQRCEAVFYNGEYALIQHNAGRAAQYFRQATNLCSPDYYENASARFELSNFGQ